MPSFGAISIASAMVSDCFCLGLWNMNLTDCSKAPGVPPVYAELAEVSVQTFVVSLTSLYGSLQTSLRLTNASRRYPSA